MRIATRPASRLWPLCGWACALLLVALVRAAVAQETRPAAAAERPPVPGGDLQILGPAGRVRGNCPLKHTDVRADVAGFLARVKVKQVFQNPTDQKIEAVYVFPLPQDAAVDDLTLTVGGRRVVGQVRRRDEARQVYEQARAAGHVAALLDQERPNVFTQSVTNIEPGAEVTVEIAFNDVLRYEDGLYEFAFPTVVAPRYVPGVPTGAPQGEGTVPDTTKVPDASRITPPLTPPGTRAGHDIGLTVRVDAGMPIREIDCKSHPVDVTPDGESRATVALKDQASLPNKDFILRYRTATDQIGDAFLAHKDERGGFFTLVLQPPRRVPREKAVGRELIFVLDTSGSMSGYPITQAKWVMDEAIRGMGDRDTFNVITFSGDDHILWEDGPRPATPENRKAARAFVDGQRGAGGTEMMKAIDAALVKTARNRPDGAPAIRVVCFMTDGEVGNDFAIIDEVKRNAGTTRVFAFGIGNSVNRFLLDGIARAGRGEVQYVTLEAWAERAAKKFYQQIDAPVLTDVAVDFGGAPAVAADDVYPKFIPDLWANRPLVLQGRLKGDPKDWRGTITLRGNTAAGPFERRVELKPAAAAPSHEALASLWARAKVADLMGRDLRALQSGTFPPELKDAVTNLGLEFRLLTQFTSFVAVEEMTVTKGGRPTKVAVPVDLPDGMSYEGLTVGGGINVGQQVAQASVEWGVYVADRATPAEAAVLRTRLAPLDGSKFAQKAGGAGHSEGGSAPAGDSSLTNGEDADGAKGGLDAKIQTIEKIRPDGPAAGPATRPTTGPATGARPAPAAPPAALDPALVGLADKVGKEGKDGTLAVGGVKVAGWKVEVLVLLKGPPSQEFRDALAKLGLEETAKADSRRAVVGTVDVRKLEELANVAGVVRVQPIGG